MLSGQTSDLSTFTEADSYLRLALLSDVFHPEAHTHPDASYGTTTTPYTKEHKALADASPSSFSRVTTETFALDSYQNLLFSVARFYQFTGMISLHPFSHSIKSLTQQLQAITPPKSQSSATK
jgi:hypothetical protein